MAESTLFKPLKIGKMELKHRVGMAPLTRMRSTEDRIPVPLMTEYYSQRASVPGTLIIAEGTIVSLAGAGGFPGGPAIWSKEQVEAWKPITDEVHRKGCFIYSQIFAFGRAADAQLAKKEGVEIVGPSAIPMADGSPVPRSMTIEEIKQSVQDFVTAAKNAVDAGFDGVEVHGANGYLTDQFLQDVSNHRDDEYGGSIENRSRFFIEILKAVAEAIGAEHVGIRLSPWSPFQGMGMENPVPQFVDVIRKASQLNLGYLHLVESRIAGNATIESNERLDFAYENWNGPLLVAGGYTLAEAQKLVDEEYPDKDIVVMFGRYFISNPDLVYRMKEGIELSAYDRKTFYTSNPVVGYTDYPFSKEYLACASS